MVVVDVDDLDVGRDWCRFAEGGPAVGEDGEDGRAFSGEEEEEEEEEAEEEAEEEVEVEEEVDEEEVLDPVMLAACAGTAEAGCFLTDFAFAAARAAACETDLVTMGVAPGNAGATMARRDDGALNTSGNGCSGVISAEDCGFCSKAVLASDSLGRFDRWRTGGAGVGSTLEKESRALKRVFLSDGVADKSGPPLGGTTFTKKERGGLRRALGTSSPAFAYAAPLPTRAPLRCWPPLSNQPPAFIETGFALTGAYLAALLLQNGRIIVIQSRK